MEEQKLFLMSLKNDFAFKLIFGDEKNKDLLAAFLGAVLKMPQVEFEGLEIINNELMREFKEDKKGILDVRARLRDGKQIDIEIQILPTDFMPQRTLYYWSKMYMGQVKTGDPYNKLTKCITINIVDFNCLPLKKMHTVFHMIEDETGYRLTDILEVHFLELTKLFNKETGKDEDEEVVDWMMFIGTQSERVIEMLAEKNGNIKKAYDILQIISKDEKARMLYEAREAELKDQVTRMMEAEQKGNLKGKLEGKRDVALKMLDMGLDLNTVAKVTDLSLEELEKLKRDIH